ncbi:MAG: mechanosensitive ion channel family protein [Bacteroidetes bacterium]|jgi:small-conductance mechanosensitive channel|nr:mechanosensitive ion channel family protein [Bacteroidota bacterium]
MTWVIAIGAAALLFVVLMFANRSIGRKLRALSLRTDTKVDDLLADVLSRTSPLVLFVVSAIVGTQALSLRPGVESALTEALWLAILLQVGFWGNGAISFWLERSMQQATSGPVATTATMSAIGFVARLALWSIVILVGLSNLGVDITGLIAGLGIGGIAVALALQNVLGDLFASLSIVLDKPFVIGDFIVVDELSGTVEYVGLKTTRIRSLSGEQLIVSNADLLRSRIRNLKRMEERRVVFTFSLTYQTPTEKLQRVSEIARGVIEAQPQVRFDRAHFKAFGESALVFECVYFVLSPDYNVYMDVQQTINIGLARALKTEGVEFAYPTRTLIVRSAESVVSVSGAGGRPA